MDSSPVSSTSSTKKQNLGYFSETYATSSWSSHGSKETYRIGQAATSSLAGDLNARSTAIPRQSEDTDSSKRRSYVKVLLDEKRKTEPPSLQIAYIDGVIRCTVIVAAITVVALLVLSLVRLYPFQIDSVHIRNVYFK